MRAVLPVAGRAGPSEPTAGRLKLLTGRNALEVLADLTRLRVVDLTHPLHAEIPFWPGAGYGAFRYERINTLERDGKAAGLFAMPEHMGTHIDAPNHFVDTPVSVDNIALASLLCPLVVFDVSERAVKDADTLLRPEDVYAWESRHTTIERGALALVRSGWSDRWHEPSSYRNEMRFPGISEAAARLLVEERHVVGIGLDTLSADNGEAINSPCHRIVHGAGAYIIENLANLELLPEFGAFAIIAPIPIQAGTGAPARVFAFCNVEDQP